MNYYLLIDTSIQGEVRVGIFDGEKIVAKKCAKVEFKYSEKILTVIDSTFGGLRINELNGVLVVVGPGRFSALRVGVTVANTLGWGLGIPVLGVESIQGVLSIEDKRKYWQEIEKLITVNIKKMFKKKKFDKFIVPEYGQEPNITLKKI